MVYSGVTYRLLLIFVFMLLYFLPVWYALSRNKTNIKRIFLMNVFLGWTCVGWCIALYLSTRIHKYDDVYRLTS